MKSFPPAHLDTQQAAVSVWHLAVFGVSRSGCNQGVLVTGTRGCTHVLGFHKLDSDLWKLGICFGKQRSMENSCCHARCLSHVFSNVLCKRRHEEGVSSSSPADSSCSVGARGEQADGLTRGTQPWKGGRSLALLLVTSSCFLHVQWE